MELHQIARDIYACLQEERGLGTSNSGLVNRGGGLVIDTFWDLPHTRQLLESYSSVCSGPVRRVLNTHRNGDHCWGNQLFEGAEILGHRSCAAAFGLENPTVMQMLRNATDSQEPAVAALARSLSEWDFSGIELRPPSTLIDDRLVLDLDGVPVHLVHVGPAHTAGDIIAHLPEQGVVFAGDVVFRLCTPVGWEGTTERWVQALDEIIELRPAVIVPGHGPLCGVEGAREMRAYLAYVRDEAERFFRSGQTAAEAARRIDLGPYASWNHPERLVANVERVYRELRGDPFDAPIDTARIFREMFELAKHLTA